MIKVREEDTPRAQLRHENTEEGSENEEATENTETGSLFRLDDGGTDKLHAAGLRPRADGGGGERQVDPERVGAAQRTDII